ncbi:p34-cdc2 protein [Perkinsela sp. CCAP 1560/4]|nr:p34-cdc2 protein [Perkinsela sp. CCAP 1560/4]|eukprot:KNH08282.1 p34-cdc2 protein [Perkinsela sp. CCAP 1560/4]
MEPCHIDIANFVGSVATDEVNDDPTQPILGAQRDDSPWLQKSFGDAVYGNEIERYVKMHKLGEGTYGAVYQCRDRNTGETVALKRMRILEDIEEGISASTIREISILYELSHPNVVTLHDVVFCESQLCLVFEFLEMDLKRYMKDFQLPIHTVKSIVLQILSGLAHCHSRRVLHRDVKPHNILISPSSLNVKLADFGLARAVCTSNSCYTQEVVTQWYRAPEILLGVSDYSPSVDVWSAGCIMGELLSGGNPVFPGDCEIDQIFKIFQMLGTPSSEDWGDFERCKYFSKHFPVWNGEQFYLQFPELDPNGFSLLRSMLQYDPTKRISAADALNHPWFSS